MSPNTRARLAALAACASLTALAAGCATVGPNFEHPAAPATAWRMTASSAGEPSAVHHGPLGAVAASRRASGGVISPVAA